jgi:cohesin loading factor subunit SCC2
MDLSESGVSTAIVQQNIHHILDGAKSQHAPTQTAAMDVLAFTVTQGLYHPLQVNSGFHTADGSACLF